MPFVSTLSGQNLSIRRSTSGHFEAPSISPLTLTASSPLLATGLRSADLRSALFGSTSATVANVGWRVVRSVPITTVSCWPATQPLLEMFVPVRVPSNGFPHVLEPAG